MTTDPLELLRAANPLPHGSAAPALERVLERIDRERRTGRGRRVWTGALVPALGAVVAIALVAVALVLIGVQHRAAPAHHATVRPPVPPAPNGGMLGVVSLDGAGFVSAAAGVISLEQCLGYRNGEPTDHTSCRDWLASTTDAGASWRIGRRPWNVFDPRLSGSDGWAEGSLALSGGTSLARFLVSHDGGRSWKVASSAAAALGFQEVSIGGNEVWAVGSSCVHGCTVTIMHGALNGSRLLATAAQPIPGGFTNVEVVAAGPRTAYVNNPDAFGQTFVTHDDGRSWQRILPPCPRDSFGRLASDGSSGSVWATCEAGHGATTLARTTDRGRSWQSLASRFIEAFQFQPVSAQVAWGTSPQGLVVRTTDGGLTWSTVWSAGASQPAALRTHAPWVACLDGCAAMLTARSVTSASVVMILTHGHRGEQARFTNLVVYRTSDGGATWNPSVVHLPKH